MRKIEPVNFVIQKSQKAKPFVVHANKLKKCMAATPASWLGSPGQVTTEDVLSHCSPGSISVPNGPESDSPDVVTVGECVEDVAVPADGNLPSRRRRPPHYLSMFVDFSFVDSKMAQVVACADCGISVRRSNLSRHKKVCKGQREVVVSPNVSAGRFAVQASSVLPVSVTGTPRNFSGLSSAAPSQSRVSTAYSPVGMSTFLKATVLEAVRTILDQHADFNELRLIAFLEKNFSEIPAHLHATIVVAATAGARHAALLHVVHGSNINSSDASKRVFAAEAHSELSFWALGLRATNQESGSPETAASGAPPAETIATMYAGTPATVAMALPMQDGSVDQGQSRVQGLLAQMQLPVALAATNAQFALDTSEGSAREVDAVLSVGVTVGAKRSSAPGIGMGEPPPVTRRAQLPLDQSANVELESPLVMHASEGDLDRDEDIGGRNKTRDVSTHPRRSEVQSAILCTLSSCCSFAGSKPFRDRSSSTAGGICAAPLEHSAHPSGDSRGGRPRVRSRSRTP